MSDSIFAVFADVHANLEALQAVLADTDAQNISRRVCLGDIVGYGANPAKCLELIRGLGCPVLQGNHDAAAAGDNSLENMSDTAQSGVEFARRKLSPEQRAYLGGLPLTSSCDGCQFVHASLNVPGDWNYIMRERDAHDHFTAQAEPLCFCGHTHFPMVLHLGDTGNFKLWPGQGFTQLPFGGKTLINVGSVGQPRDLCPDACYAIYNQTARCVEFRRVKYDIPKTRRKIMRAKLPRFAAQRLALGQ